ncbi:MAG: SRPBCC family protein, partial [Pseudomonadota bacterium]
ADYAIARSITIKAPPAVIFAHVNNLKKWQAWSPWAGRDPNSKNSYAGPPAGVGARFDWDGNDEVGAGYMKITESSPPKQIAMDLNFTRPFEDQSQVTFDFDRAADGTQVTWQLTGTNNFVERTIMTAMLIDLEAEVGKEYEAGLRSLKEVAEKEVAAAAAADQQQSPDADAAP